VGARVEGDDDVELVGPRGQHHDHDVRQGGPQGPADRHPVGVRQLGIEQPEIEQPEIEQPEIEQPEIEQPEIRAAGFGEVESGRPGGRELRPDPPTASTSTSSRKQPKS